MLLIEKHVFDIIVFLKKFLQSKQKIVSVSVGLLDKKLLEPQKIPTKGFRCRICHQESNIKYLLKKYTILKKCLAFFAHKCLKIYFNYVVT